jgi:hypothetical protein
MVPEVEVPVSGIVAGIRHNSSAWNHFEDRRVLGAKLTRQQPARQVEAK